MAEATSSRKTSTTARVRARLFFWPVACCFCWLPLFTAAAVYVDIYGKLCRLCLLAAGGGVLAGGYFDTVVEYLLIKSVN